MSETRKLKKCTYGNTYYKSSVCPTCPICEKLNKPDDNFLSSLAAPARRALENNGILTLEDLTKCTKNQVLKFHGMGKSSIPKLEKMLSDKNLNFK